MEFQSILCDDSSFWSGLQSPCSLQKCFSLHQSLFLLSVLRPWFQYLFVVQEIQLVGSIRNYREWLSASEERTGKERRLGGGSCQRLEGKGVRCAWKKLKMKIHGGNIAPALSVPTSLIVKICKILLLSMELDWLTPAEKLKKKRRESNVLSSACSRSNEGRQ